MLLRPGNPAQLPNKAYKAQRRRGRDRGGGGPCRPWARGKHPTTTTPPWSWTMSTTSAEASKKAAAAASRNRLARLALAALTALAVLATPAMWASIDPSLTAASRARSPPPRRAPPPPPPPLPPRPPGEEPNFLDGCYHVYLDVGSNVGIQVGNDLENTTLA